MSAPEISHVVDDFKSASNNPDHNYSHVYNELRELQTSGKSDDEIKSYYKNLNDSLHAAGILPAVEISGADNNQFQVTSSGATQQRDLHFETVPIASSTVEANASNRQEQAQGTTAPPASESDTKLYGGNDWRSNVNASAVTQGKYGDCFFHVVTSVGG